MPEMLPTIGFMPIGIIGCAPGERSMVKRPSFLPPKSTIRPPTACSKAWRAYGSLRSTRSI
jgi:hypothetical protein